MTTQTQAAAEKWAALVRRGRGAGEPACATYLVDRTGEMYIEAYATAEEAAADLMAFWNEEPEGPQLFEVRPLEGGAALAVLLRPDPADPQLCEVRWPDGSREAVRCVYVAGAGARHDRTEIRPA